MLQTYPMNEAKAKLSMLLDKAEKGQEIIITRHGHPVAHIVPHQRKAFQADLRQTYETMLSLRKEIKQFSIEEIRNSIEEGRR